jgi:hypothetical protein
VSLQGKSESAFSPLRSLDTFSLATKEFDELCFQFGIELDEDVSREYII